MTTVTIRSKLVLAAAVLGLGIASAGCAVDAREENVGANDSKLADCGTLAPNESLGPNQTLRACNGHATFHVREDARKDKKFNFHIQLIDDEAPRNYSNPWLSILYQAPLERSVGKKYERMRSLTMQGDGNLVLTTNFGPIWASNTSGHPGARLEIQGDCNAVIYDTDGAVLWTSATGCR